jgi:hypothetical protein
MRGFLSILAVLTLTLLSGCTDGSAPVPVTLNLKTNYQFLPAGSYSLMLALPNGATPEFSLSTSEGGKAVLVVAEKQFSQDMDYQNREWIYTIHGTSNDGVMIEGKLVESYAYICGEANSGGHRSCGDGNEFRFKGDLKRNGEIIGTLEGDVKR